MWCRDPLLSELHKLGFCPLRLPREGLAPLALLMSAKGGLEVAGSLTDLMTSTQPTPPVTPSLSTTEIRGKRTGSLRSGLGLAIIGGFIDAVQAGSTANLKATMGGRKEFVFSFEHPTEDRVDLVALDKFLTGADVNYAAGHATDLLEADKIHVVTSVLRAKSITISFEKSNDSAVAADVKHDKDAASVSVDRGKDGTMQLTYSGDRELVFAVKAVRLIYSKGCYRRFDAVKDVVRSSTDEYLTHSQFLTL